MIDGIQALRNRLAGLGSDLSLLGLRLIMAYEFGEAGLEKWRGENWFAHLQDKFPFPLSWVPADLSWALATWTEILAATLLLLGLATRLSAFVLLVLTGVAIVSVHWPESWSSLAELWQGYAISDKGQGNFKLPLLFALMLLPLVGIGPGRLSLDALIARRAALPVRPDPVDDLAAVGLALLIVGLPLAQVMPLPGYALVLAGATALGVPLWQSRRRQGA
ncbi:MAG: DoxX family protein [Xanthomonadales bacterium]|jgi:putative oxidoreductase|nr:DoxX family protein [Xanthomonadales bacterium]